MRNCTRQRGGLKDRPASRHLRQQSFPAARISIKTHESTLAAVKAATEARLFRANKGNISYLEPQAAERHQHACERRATMSGVRALMCVCGGGGRCDSPDTVNAGENAQPGRNAWCSAQGTACASRSERGAEAPTGVWLLLRRVGGSGGCDADGEGSICGPLYQIMRT